MPVYLVKAGDAAVKIGFSSADGVIARLGIIQSNNHVRLTLIRVLDGDEAVEKALHLRFASLRLHGEWFAYSPEMEGDLGLTDWAPAAAFRKPWPILENGSPEHLAVLSKLRLEMSQRPDVKERRAKRLAEAKAARPPKAAPKRKGWWVRNELDRLTAERSS